MKNWLRKMWKDWTTPDQQSPWARCRHERAQTWRMEEMSRTDCPDCGWHDFGPVHGWDTDADQYPNWTKVHG